MRATRRCEEGLRGGLVRLVSLEPLAERRYVDPKAFRKRRETILRELLAQRQRHQQRGGESIRRQPGDWSAPSREVLVTHRERLQHGRDQRPRDRLLPLCFL